MKLFIILLFSLTMAGSSLYGQEAVVQNVSVLPMTGEGILANKDVWISAGRIEAINETGTFPITKEILVIDGRGKFLLPGLSEMHAHIPVAVDGDDTRVKETMILYLSKGVTVIRGMLGNPYHLQLKKLVSDGKMLSPRIYSSSPSMNGNSVSTKEEARDKVKLAKKEGYDFLKIHPGIQLDVMQTLVRTAMEEEINYAGHVPADVGIERALKYGYKSVDHADGYIEGLVADGVDIEPSQAGFFGSGLVDNLDWNKLSALVDLTLENEVWIVPTQSLFTRWVSPEPAEVMMNTAEMSYMPASTRYAWSNNKSRMLSDPNYSKKNYEAFVAARNRILLALHKKGVRFLLGSDSPQVMNVPGFSIHHEIDALLETGIPIYDILKSGTANVAEYFGSAGHYGTLVKGASADFVLVAANPLENHKILGNPEGVMIKGKWLTKGFFEKELEKIAARNVE